MKKIIIVVVAIFVAALAYVLMFVKDVDVEISEVTVQEAVTKQISDGPIKSRGVTLIIKSAEIDFKANNTASVNIDFDADGYGYSGGMAGNFSTGLRYDEPIIYLADLSPVGIEMKLDTETQGKLNDVKNVATDFLKRQRNQMLSEEAKQSLDNILDRNQEKMKNFVISSTYKFFETLPIYDLNDAGLKGSIASLALKDVRFTADAAIVTLSPSMAIIKILSFLFTLILCTLFLLAYFGFPFISIATKMSEGES